MPNTQDPTITQKVEELTDSYLTANDGNGRMLKDVIKEAILFGQAHMKQKVIENVPEPRESVRVAYIEGTSTPDPDKSVLFKENIGFNDCREQTLSNLDKI